MQANDDVDQLVDTLLTTSRVFVALAATSLVQSGVTVTLPQYRVLIVLSAHGPQHMGQLADRLGVNASTAMRMVERLGHRNLVRRNQSSRDRRAAQVSLTETGQRLVAETTVARRAAIRELLEAVPTELRAALVDALRPFNERAGELPDQDWAAGWQ